MRVLVAALVLCGCAHKQPQVQVQPTAAPPEPETTLVVPFNTTQCERHRASGRYRLQFRSAAAREVVKTLADMTCFSFAVEKHLSATVTIPPRDQEWTADEIFGAVRLQLEQHGVVFTEDGPRRYRVSAVR